MLTTNRQVEDALNAIDPTRAEQIREMAHERGVPLISPSDYRAITVEEADATMTASPSSTDADEVAESVTNNAHAIRMLCVAMQVNP